MPKRLSAPNEVHISATEPTDNHVLWIDTDDNSVEDLNPVWGQITGTLSSQTDLQNALNGKLSSVVAGTNITIDNTDPMNPIISSTASGGGGGDVVGPASSTDNALVRFDGTTGKLVQSSAVIVDDTGSITFPNSVSMQDAEIGSLEVVDDAYLDSISELTLNAGVTIDGVLIKDGLVDGRDASVDGAKLDGVASGATANSSDATLLARANHTGTQTASTISDFSTAADARITAATGVSVQAYDADLGAIAGLSTNGSIHRTGAGTAAVRTLTGTANLITVTNGDGVAGNPTITVGANVYRSAGTDVAVADGGTGRSTSTTAYGLIAAGTTATGAHQTISPGTSGQILKSNGASALATFQTGAPADVGLGNVDNTSDANKPVSTAQQAALDAKQATLVSGTNIKTINGTTLLGAGDLVISGSGGGDVVGPASSANNALTRFSGTTGKQITNGTMTYDGGGTLFNGSGIEVSTGSLSPAVLSSGTHSFSIMQDNAPTGASLNTGLSMGSNKIVNVVDPTSNQDAATKKYVDDKVLDKIVRVIHGSTAGTARPTGVTYVEWVGSVAPTNATSVDTWIDTA